MKMTGMIAGLAVAGLSLPASAALLVNIIDEGSPTAGFNAYTVQLTNTEGDITGVDAFNQGGGFFGPMRQVWIDGVFSDTPSPGLDALAPAPASIQDVDSKFLFLAADLVSVPDPLSEDNDGTIGAAGGVVEGLGTFLTGAFASDVLGPTVDLAYLVVPDGESVEYSFRVSGAGLENEVVSGTVPASDVVIPEPASLALLGLGGLAALGRRRKA